jgi:hypothetical protein
VFINLETDPCILHSSLLCLCESSSSNSVRTSAHIRAQMLLRLPLTSVLGHYSDSHSHPRLDSTQNSTLAVLSIHLSEILVCLTAILYSCILTPLGAPCLSMLRVLRTPLRHPCLNLSYKSEPTPSDPVRTSVPVCIILVSTSPNHPTPLGCLLGWCSDIRVSFHLTSSSPRLRTPFGPPSSSAL